MSYIAAPLKLNTLSHRALLMGNILTLDNLRVKEEGEVFSSEYGETQV